MSNNSHYTTVIATLKALLETIATEKGASSEFVQRKSKLTASHFVQIMVLGNWLNGRSSLTELAQISNALGVPISASGLNQRINQQATTLLKELLGQCILKGQENEVSKDEFLHQFNGVHVVDSTYLSLPNAMKDEFPGLGKAGEAGMKLYLNYNYTEGKITALEVTSGKKADQKSCIHLDHAMPKSLHLFDLGFFKQEVLAQFNEKEAYFLCRYQPQTTLYTQEAAGMVRWHVGEELRKNGNEVIDKVVFLGEKARVPVRLLAKRLPREVAMERRRRAKEKAKKDGRRSTPSESTLALLDWAIFVTNVPEELLSVAQAASLYRLRWQIELIFKCWKSRGHLKEIGAYRYHRVLCQGYGRLIALVLFHFIISPMTIHNRELSLFKAYSLVQYHLYTMIIAITHAWNDSLFWAMWQRLEADLKRLGLKDSRAKSPTIYQLLVEAGL